MPTVAEMELLNRSFSDLGRTLQFNRSLGAREKESDLDRAMRERLAGQEIGARQREGDLDRAMRAGDYADQRENRRLMLENARAGVKSMEDYRQAMSAAKSDEDKSKVWHDLIQSGALPPGPHEGISKAMSDKLGVEVRVVIPEHPSKKFDTREGHNLALAEKYRERSQAAQRAGAGAEAERFRVIAERLERGGESEVGTTEIERQLGPVDPLTGKGSATAKYKVPADKFEAELQRILGNVDSASTVPTGPGGKPVIGVYDRVNGQLQRVGQPSTGAVQQTIEPTAASAPRPPVAPAVQPPSVGAITPATPGQEVVGAPIGKEGWLRGLSETQAAELKKWLDANPGATPSRIRDVITFLKRERP